MRAGIYYAHARRRPTATVAMSRAIYEYFCVVLLLLILFSFPTISLLLNYERRKAMVDGALLIVPIVCCPLTGVEAYLYRYATRKVLVARDKYIILHILYTLSYVFVIHEK